MNEDGLFVKVMGMLLAILMLPLILVGNIFMAVIAAMVSRR